MRVTRTAASSPDAAFASTKSRQPRVALVVAVTRAAREDEVAEMVASAGCGVIDVSPPTADVQWHVAVRTAGFEVVPERTHIERGGVKNFLHMPGASRSSPASQKSDVEPSR